VLGLVGESGCGKSTIGLSIPGLLPKEGVVESGVIDFDGQDLLRHSYDELVQIRGQRISFIFQNPMTSLNPVYRIERQLAEVFEAHSDFDRHVRRARLVELLTLVGMPEPDKRLRAFPHELSGGMRQRVMIAVALALDPDLLIADEPTTALDVTVQAQILWLLRELRREVGMAMIYITHDLVVAANLCDEIAVMYAGQIVERAPGQQLFENPLHPYTQKLLSTIPTAHWRDRFVESIPGYPPKIIQPLAACAFAPRCPVVEQRCMTAEPDLLRHTNEHSVRCVKYDNRS
jgi:peptide/nickel transport system ATP-binding protein